MHAPVKGVTVLISVGTAILMVFVLATPLVQAAPAPSTSTPAGTWSYGVVKAVSFGPQRAVDAWTYHGSATVGYTVTIYENNTSATTFELTILRTMGAAFAVQYCLPACTSPTEWVNVSYRLWESSTAIDNITTQGGVTEATGIVAAFALQNSSVSVSGNLTESVSEHLVRMGFPIDQSHYLTANVAGRASVDFAPALGLFPLNLTAGSLWSSASTFRTAGTASYSYFNSVAGALGNATNGPATGSISLTANGTVSVNGVYATGSSANLGGVAFPAVSLVVGGPFSVREGLIFIPNSIDLFGSPRIPEIENASEATSFQQSTLDLKSFVGGHFGLVASSWHYDTSSGNPYDANGTSAGTTGLIPSVAMSNPVSSTTLQGVPETQAQSSSSQECLTAGTGCPSATTTNSLPRTLFGAVVVVGAIASIGALLAIAVVSRRRQMPPPTYPNATLYPPGASPPLPAAAALSHKPGTPPPPEDDPLDHLW